MYQTQAQAAAGGAIEAAPERALSATEFKRLLLKYAGENPVKLLSVAALSYGGLLLLLYFCRIGFMPEISLESATSLLYAVALLGGFVVIFGMCCFISPGLLMILFREGKSPWLKHAADVTLSISWASVCWGAALAYLFGIVDPASYCLLFVAPLVLCAVLALGVGWIAPRANWLRTRGSDAVAAKESATQAEATAPISWRTNIALAGLCFVVMLVPLLFIFVLGHEGELANMPARDLWVAILVQVFIVAAAGIVLGCVSPSRRLGLAVLLAPVLFLAVTLGTGAFTVVPAIVVRMLGAGEVHAARLVLTARGCRTLNAAAGQAVCHAQMPGDEEPVAVCPVVLRSRMGTQLLVEFATSKSTWGAWLRGTDKKGEHSHVRVVLDKTQLLAWSPIESPKWESSSTQPDEASRQAELDRVCGIGAGLLVHARAANAAASAPGAAASRS